MNKGTKAMVVLASMGALSGVGGTASGAATKKVAVDDYEFRAKTVTLAPGDSVRWRWRGEDEHNVVFTKVPEGAKKPKRCGTRTTGSCSRTFRRKGTFSYVCSLHALMRGRVRVRD